MTKINKQAEKNNLSSKDRVEGVKKGQLFIDSMQVGTMVSKHLASCHLVRFPSGPFPGEGSDLCMQGARAPPWGSDHRMEGPSLFGAHVWQTTVGGFKGWQLEWGMGPWDHLWWPPSGWLVGGWGAQGSRCISTYEVEAMGGDGWLKDQERPAGWWRGHRVVCLLRRLTWYHFWPLLWMRSHSCLSFLSLLFLARLSPLTQSF